MCLWHPIVMIGAKPLLTGKCIFYRHLAGGCNRIVTPICIVNKHLADLLHFIRECSFPSIGIGGRSSILVSLQPAPQCFEIVP